MEALRLVVPLFVLLCGLKELNVAAKWCSEKKTLEGCEAKK